MSWHWPLRDRAPLLPDAPGQFGSVRYADVHTGVDLYCELGTEVVAVEDGEVVVVEWFTGKNVAAPDGKPADWWNDTKVVMVRGASGIVAYGEVTPRVQVGDQVKAGQVIAVVDTAVLKPFKGRPMVMLHLELYERLVRDESAPSWSPSHSAWWEKGEPQPGHLLDPTPHLPDGPRFDLSSYDGRMFRDPSSPEEPSRWWAVWGGAPRGSGS